MTLLDETQRHAESRRSNTLRAVSAHRKVLVAKRGSVLAIALASFVSCSSVVAASPAVPRPFVGNALWVTKITPPETGQSVVAEAAQAGVHTLYVKAAEGATAEAQFSTALVGELRGAGATVCAWTYAYGQNPSAEAAAAVAAVRDGAQCLIVDAEVSLDAAYRETMPGDSIYGRPILPVGQLYGSPSPPTASELTRFRALARAYGSAGTSFFDLDVAQPEELSALGAAPPRLARKALIGPTLRAGADGDEIVRAQELLNAAGAHLPIGGFYGAATARAVAAFQSRHRLRQSGVLNPATWKALLRFHARQPSWASGPPDSAK